ncbi:C-C motif chemokine 27a [Sardina pilchardus]|uniref:C-C motif chemokine 27a n=1 Tax=Sardina pilchardus TaxID=27697 RepID=UPI002E140101
MDLRGFTLLLLVIATVLLSADGSPPKCCVAVSKHIPRKMIGKVIRYEKQSSSGLCDIDALILYIKTSKKVRKVCAHPKVMRLLNLWMKKNRMFSSKSAAP